MKNRLSIAIVVISLTLLWFLFVLVSAITCNAQDGKVYTFDDFSGGMNTNSNMNLIAPNEGSYLRNLVIDNPIGALKIRPGYTLVRDSLTQFSQTLSLHAHKLDDGKTYLFHLDQWNDSGFAAIFRSGSSSRFSGGETLSRDWANELYPTPGHWLTWHGMEYFFNGRNRPQVFDPAYEAVSVKSHAPVFHPAPGQLDASPLQISGNLDGWYQYAQVIQIPCSSQVSAAVPWSKRCGVLSVPVQAHDEIIRVQNYSPLIKDSACVTADSDSIWVMTLRTRGNSNDYDLDSLFIIDSFKVRNDQIEDRVLNDTTSDASLTAGRFWGRIKDVALVGGVHRSYWGSGRNIAYAPGSMTLLGSDTTITGSDTALGSRCLGSGAVQNANLYCFTLRDRYTGVESDTSPILEVRGFTAKRNLLLGVPLTSTRYDRIIYRANFHATHSPEDFYTDGDVGYQNQVFYALDTLYLDTATTYLDQTNACSLEINSEDYNRRVPLTHYAGAIVHENKLFAWDSDQLYISVSDTAIFPFFNALEFDLGQGDPIVRCVSFNGFIAVYKKYSTWVVYTRDGTVYDARKASDGLGLVGPYAACSYADRNFVVGQDGVYSEVANPYRDNDLDRDFLDDKYPVPTANDEDISRAFAIVYKDRLMISYPGSGDTRIMFLKSNAWGFWDFDFQAACIYDTAWGPGVQARPMLVFVPPGSTKIMMLDDTATTDAGTAFQGYWQKKYIGAESDITSVVSQARMWWEGGPVAAIDVDMDVLNERSLNVGSASFAGLSSKSFARKYFAAANNEIGHYFWLRLWIPPQGPLTIRKFELVTNPAGLD